MGVFNQINPQTPLATSLATGGRKLGTALFYPPVTLPVLFLVILCWTVDHIMYNNPPPLSVLNRPQQFFHCHSPPESDVVQPTRFRSDPCADTRCGTLEYFLSKHYTTARNLRYM